MLDFDASKLLIIGVVALVVIGPKDLPGVLRQVGQMVSKLRRMAGEFQGQFMDAMKEADLQDLRNEVSKLKETASLDVAFNPVHDIKTAMTQAVEGTSETKAASALPELEPAQAAAATGADAPAFVPADDARPAGLAASSSRLELAEPAHHTPAISSGAMDAVEPPEPDGTDPGRRRRIVVAKRRPPGDRQGVGRAGAPSPGRGRFTLPPRRDPRP